LRSDIKESDSRRVKCLKHILNLTAKAFLFNKDADAFEENTNSKRSNAYIKKLRELWRKKGFIKKFHNLVLYIRVTSQRREEFLDILKEVVAKNFEGKFNAKITIYTIYINLIMYSDLMVIADNNTRWNSTYLFIMRGLKLKAKL
jgi:quinol monooxygenase YgiN